MNNSINNLLQYYSSTERYQAKQNQIPNDAIAFVEDEGVIYTHGHKFGGNSSGEVDIPDASVTTAKLANGAVTNDKLANEVKTAISSKQDALNDNPETGNIRKINGMSLIGSGNIEITPGGVVALSDWAEDDLDDPAYILHKPGIDLAPTNNSDNLISSKAVYNAFNGGPFIEKGTGTAENRVEIEIDWQNSEELCNKVGDAYIDEHDVFQVLISVDPRMFVPKDNLVDNYYWSSPYEVNAGDTITIDSDNAVSMMYYEYSKDKTPIYIPVSGSTIPITYDTYTVINDNVYVRIGFSSAGNYSYTITRYKDVSLLPNIDLVPTPNSDNLITSGGVYAAINDVFEVTTGHIDRGGTLREGYYWSGTTHHLDAGDTITVDPQTSTQALTAWATNPKSPSPVATGSFTFKALLDNTFVIVGFELDDSYDYTIIKKNNIFNSTVSYVTSLSLTNSQQATARENIGIGEEIINTSSDSKKVYLKKNIVTVGGVEKNVLVQDAFYKDSDVAASRGANDDENTSERVPNTDKIFVVGYDFDLDGEAIELPEGSTLEFEGGNITNGKIKGDVTIINKPSDIYSSVDCQELYIANDKHLTIENTKDTYSKNALCHQNRRGSEYLYSIANIDKIYFTRGSHSHVNIWIYFYDSNLINVATIYNTSYETDITSYKEQGAVYAEFVVSIWQQHILEFESYISNVYINLLDQPYIAIPNNFYNDRDANGNIKGYKNIYIGEQSPIYIEYEKSSDYYNQYNYYSDASNTTSICIPYSTFKDYDYLMVTPPAENNTAIYMLTEEPTIPHQIVKCSSWYTERLVVGRVDNNIFYKIAPDVRYIIIYCKWQGNVHTPRNVKLYTADYLRINNLVDTGNGNASSKEYISSLNIIHWNIGNFSNGGNTTAINDSNYTGKLRAFSSFINYKYADYEFLLNEYNSTFAKRTSGNVSTPNVLFTNRKYYESFVRANDTDELAIFAKDSYVGHKVGEITSLGGMESSNGAYFLVPKPYVIHKYCIGNEFVYILHTHFPTRLTENNFRTACEELISIMSSYKNAVILGDLNMSAIEAFDVFENAGYHIANDDTPTHANGRILDWCLYKGAITIENFEVLTDAVDVEDGENPMLSDHWPIKFTIKSTVTMPNRIGTVMFNENINKPEWGDGNNKRTADGELSNVRRSGTTVQRPGVEPGTTAPANVGFMYYDTDLGKFAAWTGSDWHIIDYTAEQSEAFKVVDEESEEATEFNVKKYNGSESFYVIS